MRQLLPNENNIILSYKAVIISIIMVGINEMGEWIYKSCNANSVEPPIFDTIAIIIDIIGVIFITVTFMKTLNEFEMIEEANGENEREDNQFPEQDEALGQLKDINVFEFCNI